MSVYNIFKLKNLPDFLLIIAIFVLSGIGLSMVYSTSALKTYYNFFQNQLFIFIIGIGVFLIGFTIDYHIYQKFSNQILILAFFLLLLVFVPGIGKEVSGNYRWIRIGKFNFQPSEFAKLAIVIYLSDFFLRKKEYLNSFFRSFLAPIIILTTMGILITLQPNLGTAIFIISLGFILLFMNGAKLKFLIPASLFMCFIFYIFIIIEPYRLRRVLGFLSPFSDPLDKGYHIIQAMRAFKSGGIFGKGIGQGIIKNSTLPYSHTDFILAACAEEIGFLGISIILFLYLLFFYRGIKISLNAEDEFGKKLGLGILCFIIYQVLINMYVTTGLLPITGITLPFISFGGSSLITTLFSSSILLNISTQKAKPS